MSSDRRTEVIVFLDAPELGPRRPVGVLGVTGGGKAIPSFTYARTWLQSNDAFPIDPALPLVEPDQYVGAGRLPGIFADAAPDRWGRLLLDRRELAIARNEGRRPRSLRDWDYLLGVSDVGRMGALRLAGSPDADTFLDDHETTIPPLARLRDLEQAALTLEKLGSVSPAQEALIALLLAPGSSLGGTRPKATFAAEDGALWIAKFPSGNDTREIGAWEFLLTELASRAGISVPERRLLRLGPAGRTFAAARFDRRVAGRRLYASAMTLTGRADGEDASYPEIAMAIADHAAADGIDTDLEQLFRRVVFNVLAANRDDHLRNHGFLRTPSGWRLAPAFDLNPAPEKPEHALALNGQDREPRLDLVLETSDWYRLGRSRARAIANEVSAAIAVWPSLARKLNLPAQEIAFIETAVRGRIQ